MERWRHFIRTSVQIIALLLAMVSSSTAGELRLPAAAADEYRLEPYLDWFIEAGSGQLNESDAVLLPDYAWHQRPEMLNLGVAHNTVWVRFRLSVSDSYHRDWSLHIETPHLSKVDIFEVKADKPISLYRSGLDRAFASREFSHHDYIRKLNIVSDTTYLIRLEHDEWVRAPITLKKTEHLEERLRLTLLLDGLIYGLLIGLIIFTALVIVAGRDPAHLLFLGYLISATFYISVLDGYFIEYIWPDWVPWSDQVRRLFALTTLAFGALFFTYSVEVGRQGRRLTQGILALAGGFTVLYLSSWFIPGVWVSRSIIALVLILTPLTLLTCYVSARRGDKPAIILLFGLAVQWCAIVLYLAETMAVVDLANYGIDAIKLGTVLGSTIMALALAYRIRLLAEKKRLQSLEATHRARYIAQVSHDIRTPMTGILGITDLLERAETEAQRNEHIQAIRQAGDDILMLVNDLLNEAQLKAGKLPLRSDHFELPALLSQVVQLCKAGHRNPNVSLGLDIEEDLPQQVIGDKRRLTQVLLNLVSNAVKFTHTGSVIIRVRRTNDGINFAVTDTGMGIDQATQHKLFEAFEQADEQVYQTHGGFGLGLSICRELVEEMGSTLQLDSELGRGACFHFTLATSEPAQAPEAQTGKHTSSQRIRALAGEDNEVNRKVLENFLHYEGHSIHSFSHAEALIAHWQQHADMVDVIFLDIHLPGMDGLTAARTITRLARELGIPKPVMIGISGNAMAEDQRKCQEAGMQVLLTKPLRLNRLQQVLREIFY